MIVAIEKRAVQGVASQGTAEIPTILLALLLLIVGIMQMWETIYVLTGEGGPGGSTASPAYDIFQTAFRFGRQSYAAAKGIILMFVIASILILKKQVERWFI